MVARAKLKFRDEAFDDRNTRSAASSRGRDRWKRSVRHAGLTPLEEIELPTPFGSTSDTLRLGRLHGMEIVFLARHGRQHHLLPSEVPYRANLWAMRKLGVRWLVSVQRWDPSRTSAPVTWSYRISSSIAHINAPRRSSAAVLPM